MTQHAPPENYQEWNTLLCALLFPEQDVRPASPKDDLASLKKDAVADLTARFDVEIYYGDGSTCPTLKVRGVDQGDAKQFVHAVETFAFEEELPFDPRGDLSREFQQWREEHRERQGGHWLREEPHNKECPFIAVICYLVAIARKASESDASKTSFYSALEGVRRKFDVTARNPDQPTSVIESVDKPLLAEFKAWIEKSRPHYRFDAATHYFKDMRNVGWLKEHAMISNHEERTVLTLLYESNQGPGVALSRQLKGILLQLIPTTEARLVRIIRNHWETCKPQVCGMIRDWDGTCPADDEDGRGSDVDGNSVASTRGRLKLLLNIDEQRREAYCTVVLDGDIGEDYENFQAKWNDQNPPAAVDVECCYGAEVCRVLGMQPIRVSPRTGGILSISARVQIKLNPPINGQTTLFFRKSAGVGSKWQISNGPFRSDEALWVLSTDDQLTAPNCDGVIKSSYPDLLGYKLLRIPLVDKVCATLRDRIGLIVDADSEIRFIGGIQIGRERRFFIDAPPTIESSCTNLTFPLRQNGTSAWTLQNGAYHFERARDELRWEGTVVVNGTTEYRIRLDSADIAPTVAPFSRRLLHDGSADCSGNSVQPNGVGLEFVPRAKVQSNDFKMGRFSDLDVSKMNGYFRDDLSRCPGIFLIELVKKVGYMSVDLFDKALRHCTARSGKHALLDSISWIDVSRRQRDCLVGLGHCEYDRERRCLVALKTTASLLPRECRTSPGQFSFVAVVHAWTRSDYQGLRQAVTHTGVELLLHPQPKGAIALPPRLSLVAASVDEIKAVLDAVKITLLESLSLDSRIDALFGADALANAPDIGLWNDVGDPHRCTSANPDSVEVFSPRVCRWVKHMNPWVDPKLAGTWAIRTPRLNRGGNDYYLLVRPTATLGHAEPLRRAQVASDPWPAAAWYAWVAWQRSRTESVLISQQGQAERLAIPFVARPPWWLDRVLCSCSGLAPEWQNFHNVFGADDLKKMGGYPVPEQLVDPESLSTHAHQIRLLTYNDILPETITKRLLWPFTEHKKFGIAFVD